MAILKSWERSFKKYFAGVSYYIRLEVALELGHMVKNSIIYFIFMTLLSHKKAFELNALRKEITSW